MILIDLLSAHFAYLSDMQGLPEEMQIFPGMTGRFGGGARARQLVDHHHHRLDVLAVAAEQALDGLVSDGCFIWPRIW